MSERGEKGATQSKSEKGEKRKSSAIGDGVRPESLPEITHSGWKEWDPNMLKLKEYMRSNFQDLQIICPDPMLLTIKPAYKVYRFKAPNFTLLESFTEFTDPKGYRAKMNDINTVVGPAIPGLRAVPDLVPIHPILPPTVHIHL